MAPVLGSIGSLLVGFTVGDLLQGIGDWIASGTAWLLGQVGHALDTTTTIQLGSSWFLANYRTMAAIAAATVLPFLLCTAIQAVVAQRLDVLVRSALLRLPLALLLSAVAVQLVALALAVTDAMSSAVSTGAGQSLTGSIDDVERATASLVATGSQVPGFAVALVSVLVASGAVVLWLELLVREAAVYVAVLFLPLALAGLVWPATAHWCRRLVDTLAALVVSKFVIVAVLSLGGDAVGSVASGGGFAAALAGVAMLLLATLMPVVLLHLVPMAADGAVSGLDAARQRAVRTAVAVPRSAASFALRQAGGLSLAAAVPGTGTSVTPGTPGLAGTTATTGDGGVGGPGEPGGLFDGGAGPAPGGDSGRGGRSDLRRSSGAGGAGATGGLPTAGTGAPADSPGSIPMWRGRGDADIGAAPHPAPIAGATGAPLGGSVRESTGPGQLPTGGAGTPGDGLPGAVSATPAPWWEPPAGRAADDPDGSGEGASAGVAAASTAGEHRLERDEMGPVIRWVPDGGRPATGPEAGAGAGEA